MLTCLANLQLGTGFKTTYIYTHTRTHGFTCRQFWRELSTDTELTNRFTCYVQKPTLLRFLQADGCCLEQLQKSLWEKKKKREAGMWAAMAGVIVTSCLWRQVMQTKTLSVCRDKISTLQCSQDNLLLLYELQEFK